jgi:hypothetical protein
MNIIRSKPPKHNTFYAVLNKDMQRFEITYAGIVLGYVPVPQNGQATARLVTKMRYAAATHGGAA